MFVPLLSREGAQPWSDTLSQTRVAQAASTAAAAISLEQMRDGISVKDNKKY
jgi:hypothetical protein